MAGQTFNTTGGTVSQAVAERPAQKAAAGRVQRYYNKASGRMETAQQLHSYRAPVPAGHQVSSTKQTTTREVTRSPAPAVSFINMTPAQIEARAKAIVGSELAANKVPFQQQLGLLGQEQTSALGTNTTAYNQLGATIQGQQTAQEGSAKTFENYAADAVNKASQAAPGAAQTAERLGLKPGEALPQSVQQQQEAARTLLTGIASAAQGGVNQRQQSESGFLANMKATAAQGGVESGRAIEGQFGKQKASVLGQEAGLVAKAAGSQAKLTQALLGEQQKDRVAAEGLGLKFSEASSKQTERTQKIAASKTKEGNETKKVGAEVEYKRATAGEKVRQDEIKNRQAQERISLAAQKNSAKAGGKSTPTQVNKLSGQLGAAFTTFERLRVENEGYNVIRQKLATGQEPGRGTVHYYKGKPVGESEGKRIKIPKVEDGVLVRAAEEAWRYHAFSPSTLQQLASKGLAFSSQREAYEVIAGRPYTPPQNTASGVTGRSR